MSHNVSISLLASCLASLMVLLCACERHTASNFPPGDPSVKLDSTNLPIVWIETGGDSIMRDRRIGARMTIVCNGEGKMNYADTLAHPRQHACYRGYIALRHRGNSSYRNSPKKPYSFRTLDQPLHRGYSKKKVKLLGMGKDNNWVLLAPYADGSMVRDALTMELARPYMEYVPQGRYCELVLDGVYYGVYVLSEVVSKGKQRLALDEPGKQGDELTGGYLLEVDCDDEATFASGYPPVSNNGQPMGDRRILFQYKFPKRTKLSPAQARYIHSQVAAMERSLADPNGDYSRYIDVASFIDYQLMMELCHNVDAYRLSGKLFKRRDSEDARFKMVLWDTNLGYGLARHSDGWRADTWVYQSNDLLYSEGGMWLVPFWWHRLNNDVQYTRQLKARWAEYRSGRMSERAIMATVDSLTHLLTAHGAIDRNSRAWPRWGQWVWPNHYVARDYEDEISHLKLWLRDRLAWMDEQLGYQP